MWHKNKIKKYKIDYFENIQDEHKNIQYFKEVKRSKFIGIYLQILYGYIEQIN